MDMKFEEYWNDICKIHLFTKHYLLLAEELATEGDLFLQPLKEHRDAYDHVIRVYATQKGINKVKNPDSYMQKNMSKALGHEYRAFFDTADWLTLICREKINSLLCGKSREEIEKKYLNYKELKKMLLELPNEIAQLRENKDVGKDNISLLDEVDQYVKILDKLLLYYNELVIAIEGL